MKPTTWSVEPKGLAWLLILVLPQVLVVLTQKWNMMTTMSHSVKNATLFWVNPGIPPDHNNTQNTTVLERWGDLNVGEVIRVNTYVGHRWIVQINGSAIQEWRISEDAAYKHDVLRFELYQEDIDDNNDSDDAIEDVKSEL